MYIIGIGVCTTLLSQTCHFRPVLRLHVALYCQWYLSFISLIGSTCEQSCAGEIQSLQLTAQAVAMHESRETNAPLPCEGGSMLWLAGHELGQLFKEKHIPCTPHTHLGPLPPPKHNRHLYTCVTRHTTSGSYVIVTSWALPMR